MRKLIPTLMLFAFTTSGTASAAEPVAGATFTMECASVTRIIGAQSSFSFMCRTAAGSESMLTLAKWHDTKGAYPTTQQETETARQSDTLTAANMASIVTSFLAVKTDHPNAVLKISGLYSKLPSANKMRVVSNVTLVVN